MVYVGAIILVVLYRYYPLDCIGIPCYLEVFSKPDPRLLITLLDNAIKLIIAYLLVSFYREKKHQNNLLLPNLWLSDA